MTYKAAIVFSEDGTRCSLLTHQLLNPATAGTPVAVADAVNGFPPRWMQLACGGINQREFDSFLQVQLYASWEKIQAEQMHKLRKLMRSMPDWGRGEPSDTV